MSRRGSLLGTYRKHNFGHIRFVLSQRRGNRWAADPDRRNLRPGHPVYERLRAEWQAEAFGDEQDVIDSIDRMIDQMQQRSIANSALLDEPDEGLR